MAGIGHGGGSSFATSQTDGKQKNMQTALYALMVLFFMMGFITCMNDILIPYLKVIFKLNFTQINLVNLCFFGAYGIMSIPAGNLVKKYGYKSMMILGFFIAAVGCLMFYPAAQVKVFGMFLVALFVLATGIVLLQVAGNPYVAVLGPAESSSSRLTFTQALNSLGTTIAPAIGQMLILSKLPNIPDEIKDQKDLSKLSPELEQVLNDILAKTHLIDLQVTYLGIAGVFVSIGLALWMMKLPNIGHGEGEIDTDGLEDKGSIWNYSNLVLGVVGIFVYVGAEVSIGSHIINYLEMPSVMNFDAKHAGSYVSYYWGGAMVGRFLGTVILSRVNPGKVLGMFAVSATTLIAISVISTGAVSMWTLLAIGLANSIMFPTIFTLAIKGLGKYTDQASGILCTAIVGGAILPMAYGFTADTFHHNLKIAMAIPFLCYVFIAYYGFKGHKVK